MKKQEYRDEYLLKEEVLSALLKPCRTVKSVTEYAEEVMKALNRLTVYVKEPDESIDYAVLQERIAKAVDSCEVKMPQLIQFMPRSGENFQVGDTRPFKSTTNYLIQVCLKAIEFYGEERFKRLVFSDKAAHFFCPFTPYFVKSPKGAPSVKWVRILDDCYVIGELSWKRTVELVTKLVEMFPGARHSLVYVN